MYLHHGTVVCVKHHATKAAVRFGLRKQLSVTAGARENPASHGNECN